VCFLTIKKTHKQTLKCDSTWLSDYSDTHESPGKELRSSEADWNVSNTTVVHYILNGKVKPLRNGFCWAEYPKGLGSVDYYLLYNTRQKSKKSFKISVWDIESPVLTRILCCVILYTYNQSPYSIWTPPVMSQWKTNKKEATPTAWSYRTNEWDVTWTFMTPFKICNTWRYILPKLLLYSYARTCLTFQQQDSVEMEE